jgi:hypothetical protein
MSNLLSVSAMVTECQSRVPIGLSSAFWVRKLNEGFRWISQKGNFIWDIQGLYVSTPVGYTTFDIPNGATAGFPACDPGKPMYLSGPVSSTLAQTGNVFSTIPYKPWDESLEQQYAEVVAPPGLFSCWTFATNFTTGAGPTFTPNYSYKGYLYPHSAAATSATGAFTFTFAYHTDVSGVEYATTATATAPNYFPTPNSFDNLIIELAEAEARRIYGLAGFEMIQKRAESAIVNLLDSYRSTKNVLSGLTDQQKQASEKKMMAQERS